MMSGGGGAGVTADADAALLETMRVGGSDASDAPAGGEGGGEGGVGWEVNALVVSAGEDVVEAGGTKSARDRVAASRKLRLCNAF